MQAAMKEHLDRRLQHRALQSLVAFITAASIVACEGRPPKDRFDDVKSPSIAFLRAFMSLDVDYVEIRAVGYADAVDFARFRSYAVDPRLQKTGPKVESLTVVNLETIDGNPYHLAASVIG